MTLLRTRDFAVDVRGIAAELSTSKRKLQVFEAVYSGGNRPKDARTLAAMVGMDRVSVLQVASPMASKGYFEALKVNNLLCFRKYREINAVKDQILRLARNERRLSPPKGTGLAPKTRPPTASPSKIRTKPARSKRFDVALSFAGEDRRSVKEIARKLRRAKVRVFYDEYQKAALWGTDLYAHLKDVYSNKSTYCVVFISKHYKRKPWTKHELSSAQEKAFRQHRPYILPVKVDDTRIPSLFATTGRLDLRTEKAEGVFRAIMEKLGKFKPSR
jgi:hypothetical protein